MKKKKTVTDRHIEISNLQKKFRLKIDLLQKQASFAVDFLGKRLPQELREIAVYLVSSKKIAELHRDFLNDPTPTDVITFEHGEIFVCPEVAETQRKKEDLSLHDEVLTYVIHGLLHLTGLDDHGNNAFERMRKEQTKVLNLVLKNHQ